MDDGDQPLVKLMDTCHYEAVSKSAIKTTDLGSFIHTFFLWILTVIRWQFFDHVDKLQDLGSFDNTFRHLEMVGQQTADLGNFHRWLTIGRFDGTKTIVTQTAVLGSFIGTFRQGGQFYWHFSARWAFFNFSTHSAHLLCNSFLVLFPYFPLFIWKWSKHRKN